MDSNKRHRIISLEDLKLEFVEKRRKSYLEDLENLAETNNLEYLYNSDQLQLLSKDCTEKDKLSELGFLAINNIDEILVFPEFITCLDSLISEEVSLMSNSLFFVRPDGPRVLVQIKNYIATVYNKIGKVQNMFQVKSKGPTVLDCVDYSENFNNSNIPRNLKISTEDEKFEMYYILDVLMLNGSVIATSELKCRLFFLNSMTDEINSLPNVFFKFVEYHETGTDVLESLYNSIKSKEYEYETDSLVFVNKMASYVGGYNPNWLCFRDSILNKYCFTSKVTSKVLLNEDKLYTFDNVLIGEVQESYKTKIVKILINNIDDFKINYQVIGQVFVKTVPDTLRKIYVNFMNNFDQKEENFKKILNKLSNCNS